jgi:hypothetical protein
MGYVTMLHIVQHHDKVTDEYEVQWTVPYGRGVVGGSCCALCFITVLSVRQRTTNIG